MGAISHTVRDEEFFSPSGHVLDQVDPLFKFVN